MNRPASDGGSGRHPAPPVLVDEEAGTRQRKKEEFRTWFFLTFVMAPILAVAIVSAFGFAVWIWQLFVGPPGS